MSRIAYGADFLYYAWTDISVYPPGTILGAQGVYASKEDDMNRQRTVISFCLLLALAALLVSCGGSWTPASTEENGLLENQDEVTVSPITETIAPRVPCTREDIVYLYTSERVTPTLELSDFDFLRRGISMAEVVHRVGPANRDTGSGESQIEYDLVGGDKVSLTFAEPCYMEAAYLLHADGSFATLVPPR